MDLDKNITSLIEKLNDQNYNIWSFKMKAIMQEKEIFYTIEESEPVLNENQSNQRAVDKWKKDDKKAYNLIALHITSSEIIHVRKANSAKEAWNNLKDEHQKSSQATKIRIFKKLFQSRLQHGENLREHLNNLLELNDQLSDMGIVLESPLTVACVIASLSNEYDALVTGIETWDESKLTMTNVKARLLEEYEKKKEAQSFASSTKQISVNKPLENYNPYENLKCGYCKKKGHIKKNCKKLAYATTKREDEKKQKEDIINAAAHSAANMDTSYWYVDSGANRHVSSQLELFSEIRNEVIKIKVANGSEVESLCSGNIKGYLVTSSGQLLLINLRNVLYVENKSFVNLISVKALASDNFTIQFSRFGCELQQNDLAVLAYQQNSMYMLNIHHPRSGSLALSSISEDCIHVWHRKLSHRNLNDVRKLLNERNIKFKECKCNNWCESCIQGKMKRSSFPKKASEVTLPCDVIVSDVCGPMPVTSVQGYRYFMTFTDAYSNYTDIRFLKEKSEVANEVIKYIQYIKVQFNKTPKIFRSDRGTEYTVDTLQKFLKSQGILFQHTVGYAPEQNGIAERKNRTLVEAARTMLIDADLPKNLWSEAINEACYNLNRVFGKKFTNFSPFEKFYLEDQDFNDFHVFGSEVYIHVPSALRKKLDSKAIKCKYLGHDSQAKGYRVYDLNTKTIKITRDIVFLDHHNVKKNPFKQIQNIIENKIKNQVEIKNSENKNSEIQKQDEMCIVYLDEPDHHEDIAPIGDQLDQENIENGSEVSSDEEFFDPEEPVIQNPVAQQNVEVQNNLRRSARQTAGKLPAHLEDYEVYSANSDNSDPKSYSEAIKSSDKNKWLEAMNSEIKNLEDNNTWSLVDLPKDRSAIGSKWVFKKKRDQDGNIIEYKARLVAQGFSQKYGVDYDEVFAPVTRANTFRLLLNVSALRNYEVRQFDIKAAFLNGDLEEDIYMRQPSGFKNGDKVFKLNKSLYGLKQAARVWNIKIHQVLCDNGFNQSHIDKCLYIKHSDNQSCYLIIHVDDILVSGTSSEIIKQTQDILGQQFSVKDLGEIKYYLGISVFKDKVGNYFINQANYIDKIVSEAGLTDAKTSKYPLDPGYYKLQNSEPLLDNQEYRKLIGMLLYVTTNSRPDIASSVSILSQKVSHPDTKDLVEVKRVIKYLAATKDLCLRLSNKNSDHSDMLFYSDANWAEDRTDRKSNSGYIGFVSGGTISWACHKQACVSLSSTEAEYVALTEATQELLWLKDLCKEFSIKIQYPVQIKADNQSAIKIVSNQKFSNSTKHIETKYHFIKSIKEQNIIGLQYCPAEYNIADMLTKPLAAVKLKDLRSKAGLTNLESGASKPLNY